MSAHIGRANHGQRDSDKNISSIRSALTAHLDQWGLRHFDSDAAYFAWQREVLSPAELHRLHDCIIRKQAPGAGATEEIAFYNATAQPSFIPALYSQRYEYYCAIGPLVSARVASAGHVLDFGCGIGLLTTFYARQCPNIRFVGVDRSPASIDYAIRHAREFNLSNVEFQTVDLDREVLAGQYDVMISTHALLQAERDPGLPSAGWQTFARPHDQVRQTSFETRTQLAARLDHLTGALTDQGRLLLFEKTRLLARRVPFQRALAARGFCLLEPPQPIRYALVEEVTEDGPFYVVSRAKDTDAIEPWTEEPEEEQPPLLDIPTLKRQHKSGMEPLYENHTASAQGIWEALDERHLIKQCTKQDGEGGELHAELGTSQGLLYLYVANTFDQRQIVLMEAARANILEDYYAEIERP